MMKKLPVPDIPPSMTVTFTFWFDGGTLTTVKVRANSLERAWIEFRAWWPEDRAIVAKVNIIKDRQAQLETT
jgi:hypothetical protein